MADVLRMGNAQALVATMIARGTRKTKPLVGSLTLTPGSLLVFVDNAGVAGHSCVAITAQSIAGYNQLGWFSAGGANHAYSTHNTNQLIWGNMNDRNKVRRALSAGWFHLYEVPEGIAKAIVRAAAQV
jgi:hypothetical protein